MQRSKINESFIYNDDLNLDDKYISNPNEEKEQNKQDKNRASQRINYLKIKKNNHNPKKGNSTIIKIR